MYKKFKSFIANETFFFAVLLALVALISFELGRNSILDSKTLIPQPIGVSFMSSSVVKPYSASEQNISVVGSRSGSKYHLLTCPGALQMKTENMIMFDSYKLARAAGYSPASNCPGL
ncbi:MAG: hypothetical protein LR008_00330 [Candidatus Pacebacteria bacterium]|nr:hypothetical protein [Candidatus Paceibacterota bacterium]